jgi:hypothetical protein
MGMQGAQMVFDNPSRRAFIGGGLALSAAPTVSPQTPGALTADQVIERIRQNVGVPWRNQTVDKIVFGDGATPVKGVATTMMARPEIEVRASARPANGR